MSNNKKIEAKDYPNVFAFIAAVIEADRELQLQLQLQPQANTGWANVHFTNNTVRSCGSDLYANTLIDLFKEGRLRVKPKFKTVEGYVMLTCGTSATSAHLPFYANNPFVYADKECSPARRTAGDIIAKITFEVEE